MTEFPRDSEAAEARLDALIAAYGANPLRWPLEERDAAARFAGASRARLARLAQARSLDGALDRAPNLAPRWPLEARIIAAAPRPKTIGAAPRAHRRLAIAAGLAAACASGVIVGLFAAPVSFAPTRAPAADVSAEAALLLVDPADTADG